MQIFVRNIAGRSSVVDVESTTTVEQLKSLVQENGMQQNLYYCGKNLVDGCTVADYSIENDCTVYATLALDGGAKKKKKVFTKPKKNKHKNKKIKLRVLNLYKIEGDNITRTRKECKKCGAGYFMASHSNRYYCGACHYTVDRTDA